MEFNNFVNNNSAVLIFTPVNRRYLTGFPSSYGYLLISQFGYFLFVDSRYYEAACRKVNKNCTVILLERASRQLNELIKKYGIKHLYVETEITVADLNAFTDTLNTQIIPSAKLSEEIVFARSVKTEEEIKCIETAQNIAEEAFSVFLKSVKEGMTEKEAACELDYQMQKHGSSGVSFDTITLFGKNTSVPHGVPSDYKLKNGNVMLFDFGAIYNGYHSDMTRTVVFGKSNSKLEYIYKTVLSAQNAAINTVKAGVAASIVDSAARNIITNEGYAGNFMHSTGHGVGLEIHEYPNITYRNSKQLCENQVITCEPGIYLKGEFGVRIEDMLVVKNNMCKNLTKAQKTLIIL